MRCLEHARANIDAMRANAAPTKLWADVLAVFLLTAFLCGLLFYGIIKANEQIDECIASTFHRFAKQ